MCRCVTCAISCASTEASSDSLSAAVIRPACTPTKPPGSAKALTVCVAHAEELEVLARAGAVCVEPRAERSR